MLSIRPRLGDRPCPPHRVSASPWRAPPPPRAHPGSPAGRLALAAGGFISFLIRNGAEGPGRGQREREKKKGKQQKIASPGCLARRRQDLVRPAGPGCPGGRAPACGPSLPGDVQVARRPWRRALLLRLSTCKMDTRGRVPKRPWSSADVTGSPVLGDPCPAGRHGLSLLLQSEPPSWS